MVSRNAAMISRMAPIVMHESATLKVGNDPTWTKSTTRPRRKPGLRDDPIDQVAERAAEHEGQRNDAEAVARRCTARTSTTDNRIARTASTRVALVKRLKAPPLLRVRWSSTSCR